MLSATGIEDPPVPPAPPAPPALQVLPQADAAAGQLVTYPRQVEFLRQKGTNLAKS